MENIKKSFYTWVTGHKKSIILIFFILAGINLLLKPMVGVNYDMKDYLPKDSPSTIALTIMSEEYAEGVPNARVMLKEVSVPQALSYKEKIGKVDGVEAVTWLDDTVNPAVSLVMMDEELVREYYNDGNALLQVVIDEGKLLPAVAEINEIIGDKNSLTGEAVSTAVATESTVKEIMLITILAVFMVLIILIFSSVSWLEPIIILVSIGVAIVINAGTNILFGEISFVTNAAGSVLQLAVSLDYAVFLLHRYHEYREVHSDPGKAMVEALCKSTNSIFSSGITTVIGFMALVLMRFLLGPDLGWALAKGITISLITVFVFLPALFLQSIKAVEKTAHRTFLPSFHKFGKVVVKVMIPMVCVFTIAIVPAFLASNANEYYYGAEKIFSSDTKLGSDTERIKETFGQTDTYALLLPKGQTAKEKTLSSEIKSLDKVERVVSYVDLAGAEIPDSFIAKDDLIRLESEKYTRMVITSDVSTEGADAFELVESINKLADEYYPGEFHLAGSGPSNYDLMDTITEDMMKVNLIAIVSVYLVLLLMMRSFLLPVLLVVSIETAIWINTAIPYFLDTPIFYIAYLIISTVQLGATVDYAILLTDRYRECRETLNRKDAVVQTMESTVPSILVSGLTLTIVGTLMGKLSTHGLLAQLGVFLGRGAVLSMAIVFFVLPGFLYIFDKLYINRGKKKMKSNKKVAALLIGALMVSTVIPAVTYADSMPEKEEVIYATLSHNGSVEDIHVVNSFTSEDITDHGKYTETSNLTTTDKITYKNGKVVVNASETPFYYEGVMPHAELPWDIELSYMLNGVHHDAEDLAGKSGRLKIDIDVSKNSSCDSFFYDNYALQIIMTMDSNYCRNITANGATIANIGSDKQITYTIMPGKGADITVTADVADFEMDEISINGIKLQMDVDVDISKLMSEAEALEEGANKIDAGASEVKSGAYDLKKGASEILEGVKNIRQAISSAAYKEVMSENGLDVDQLKQGNVTAIEQMKEMLSQIIQYENAGGTLTPEQQQQKIFYSELIRLLEGNNVAISGAEAYLDTLNGKANALETGAEELLVSMGYLYDGAEILQNGTETLKKETLGMDEKINEEIENVESELTGSEEVRSFTSSKNTNVKSVQFALKTDSIDVEEEKREEKTEEKAGFFEKLKNLFR